MTDHDLLVRIDERQGTMATHFSNHIKHHWAVTISLLMIVAGLVVALWIR